MISAIQLAWIISDPIEKYVAICEIHLPEEYQRTMEFKGIILAGLAVSMCLVSCGESEKINAEPATTTIDTLTILNEVEMKSYIPMFEIPATDISRAINFYQAVLNHALAFTPHTTKDPKKA